MDNLFLFIDCFLLKHLSVVAAMIMESIGDIVVSLGDVVGPFPPYLEVEEEERVEACTQRFDVSGSRCPITCERRHFTSTRH